MQIELFKKLPVVGIVRGVPADCLAPLVEACVNAGLKTLEITMNTPFAPALIKQAVKAARGRLTIGAGTVLTLDELKEALDSGATFIVSPVLVPAVVERCVKKKVPVFPGALTPQEIYNAAQAGATMVKVFPVGFFGPAYIKEIKGPLPQIELLACGGVKAENIKNFFANGASAVAFGGSIFSKERFAAHDFASIESDIRLLLSGFNHG